MNSSFKHVVLTLLAIVSVSFAITGCQTSKGLGQDVEKLGENIQDAAK